MYYSFFGLNRNPFGMAPDPEFLFLTGRHREAIAGLTYAITERKGFLVLSGQAGTGKTTVLNWTMSRLSGTKVAVSVILNPMLTPNEFLEAAMLGFGIQEIPNSRPRCFLKLEKFLREIAETGSAAALIVDEAHKLTPELLEEIRLMGNYDHGGEKLLQILLIGQSEIDELLNRPDLRQLKQRVCVHLTVEPLDRVELDFYIRHRWKKAGGQDAPFTPEVRDRVFYWSGGIPRLVNALSDNALILAFADNERTLRVEYIDSVAKDLQLVPIHDGNAGPQSGAESKAAAPDASPEIAGPVTPVRLMTLERYEKTKKSAPFFMRLVGKRSLA